MPKFIDLTGQRKGVFTILDRGPNDGKKIQWLCRCNVCDTERLVRGDMLLKSNLCMCNYGKRADRRGEKHGDLTVIGRSEKKASNGETMWICRCELCERVCELKGTYLEQAKNCGCQRGTFINLKGLQFGRLTVIYRGPNSRSGQTQWYCKCSCGEKELVLVTMAHLSSGATQSCGCLNSELARERRLKHGVSRRSKEHRAWMELRYRCGNDGVILPGGWDLFENFFAAVGHMPQSKSVLWIKDPNRGFDEAGNWEWISRQAFANKRCDNFMLDEALTVGDASKIFRINRETLRKRKLRGLPIKQILSPARYLKGPNYLEAVNNKSNNHRIVVNDESMTIAQAARRHGLPYKKLWKRIAVLGWPVARALTA
jgi:hypothetical protein